MTHRASSTQSLAQKIDQPETIHGTSAHLQRHHEISASPQPRRVPSSLVHHQRALDQLRAKRVRLPMYPRERGEGEGEGERIGRRVLSPTDDHIRLSQVFNRKVPRHIVPMTRASSRFGFLPLAYQAKTKEVKRKKEKLWVLPTLESGVFPNDHVR